MQAVFIQIAARKNGDLLQPAIVQDAPDIARMCGEVAAIQAYAFDVDAFLLKFFGKADHLACGSLGVIGIDQQDDVGRMGARKMFEGGCFIRMRLDERVRHRAEQRHVIQRPASTVDVPENPAR